MLLLLWQKINLKNTKHALVAWCHIGLLVTMRRMCIVRLLNKFRSVLLTSCFKKITNFNDGRIAKRPKLSKSKHVCKMRKLSRKHSLRVNKRIKLWMSKSRTFASR